MYFCKVNLFFNNQNVLIMQTEENFKSVLNQSANMLGMIEIPETLEKYLGKQSVKVVGNSIRSVKPSVDKPAIPRSVYEVHLEFPDKGIRTVGILDKAQKSLLSFGSTHKCEIVKDGEWTNESTKKTYPNFKVIFGSGTEQTTIEKPAVEAKAKEATAA